MAEDPDIAQKIKVSKARRGLKSVSTISISDIEAAEEEFRRRNQMRLQLGPTAE